MVSRMTLLPEARIATTKMTTETDNQSTRAKIGMP